MRSGQLGFRTKSSRQKRGAQSKNQLSFGEKQKSLKGFSINNKKKEDTTTSTNIMMIINHHCCPLFFSHFASRVPWFVHDSARLFNGAKLLWHAGPTTAKDSKTAQLLRYL
jgi:hypothetical protein